MQALDVVVNRGQYLVLPKEPTRYMSVEEIITCFLFGPTSFSGTMQSAGIGAVRSLDFEVLL